MKSKQAFDKDLYPVWPCSYGEYDETDDVLTKAEGFMVIAPDGEVVCYCQDEDAAKRIALLLAYECANDVIAQITV